MKLGEDNIIITHDSTKMDKGGQKLVTKDCYANPKDPQTCLNTSLGIWLCLEQDRFETTEFLFRTKGTKDGTASKSYCDHLTELLRKHQLEVLAYAEKSSAHGIRKGSASAISSGTMLPPPIASIAAQGDWSLGTILDIYWQFSDCGDYYLGRSLTMIDINSEDFAILPPHFISINPLDDPDIKEAINLMYPKILEKYENSDENPTGLLLRLLASVIYHSDWIKEVGNRTPGHPFLCIPFSHRLNAIHLFD